MGEHDFSLFSSLDYLESGSPRQQAAFQAITDSGVMDLLAAFTPILAGTIPLGIDIESSDLDIICEVHDAQRFVATLTSGLSSHDGFNVQGEIVQGLPTIICCFNHMGFPFEIFGQPVPVREQNAYLHMVAEHRLLQTAGPEAKGTIRALKRQGLKTEPAFAFYFGIPGDPYETLLEMGRSH